MDIEQMRIRMGEMAAEIERLQSENEQCGKALNGEIILCDSLRAQNARLQSIIDEANAQKPVGYMVRGSFFYSKVEAEKSADHLTANYENTDVINVFVDPIPAQQCAHGRTSETQTGDGVPVYFCLECGKNSTKEFDQQSPSVSDYEDVLTSHRELVRELDVLLNGDGAAKQASLCDVVSQVSQIVREKGSPLLRQSLAVANACAECGKDDPCLALYCVSCISSMDGALSQSPAVAVHEGYTLISSENMENFGNREFAKGVRSAIASPRITEQDFIEILSSYSAYAGADGEMYIFSWLKTHEGRALLAELNDKNNIPN